jgi:hypothetical protein
VEKDREELEETMQATKSILDETRAMQNQTEEARRKIQVRVGGDAHQRPGRGPADRRILGGALQTERDELVVYMDELEGKKEQSEALVKRTQDRVKALEAEGQEKDAQLAELDRIRREQEKAAAELQRS